MSRFLARARALLRAEVQPIAREPQGATAQPRAPVHGAAWPDGVDDWLTRDAVTLAGILNTGGTARFCPNGGLDVWRPDGRYLGFSPDLVRRLRAAGLLHPSLSPLTAPETLAARPGAATHAAEDSLKWI